MKPAVHVDVASLLVAVAGVQGGLSTWHMVSVSSMLLSDWGTGEVRVRAGEGRALGCTAGYCGVLQARGVLVGERAARPAPGTSAHTLQILALVFTFGSGQPGVQALALTLLSILYAVAHCFVAPMRCPMSQTLQTTLLLCLAAVVLSGTPQAAADAVERATSAYVASASDLLARRLQRWLGLVVPCLAVCAAFVWPAAVRWWAARGKAPSSVRAL